MARVYTAGSNLPAQGDREVFEYRRGDDRDGLFATTLVQYGVTEAALKIAISDLKVSGVMDAINKALLVKAQGAASSNSGREKRQEMSEKAKAISRAVKSADPKVVEALKLLGLA